MTCKMCQDFDGSSYSKELKEMLQSLDEMRDFDSKLVEYTRKVIAKKDEMTRTGKMVWKAL